MRSAAYALRAVESRHAPTNAWVAELMQELYEKGEALTAARGRTHPSMLSWSIRVHQYMPMKDYSKGKADGERAAAATTSPKEEGEYEFDSVEAAKARVDRAEKEFLAFLEARS